MLVKGAKGIKLSDYITVETMSVISGMGRGCCNPSLYISEIKLEKYLQVWRAINFWGLQGLPDVYQVHPKLTDFTGPGLLMTYIAYTSHLLGACAFLTIGCEYNRGNMRYRHRI